METSQFTSQNQLTGFYMIQVFTEQCFGTDFKANHLA